MLSVMQPPQTSAVENSPILTRLLLSLSKLRKNGQLSDSNHGTAKERALKEDQERKIVDVILHFFFFVQLRETEKSLLGFTSSI